MKEEPVIINGITIKRLKIADFALVLKKINTLPGKLSQLPDMGNDAILSSLPSLIADALPDLVGILSVATDATEEQIMELDLADFTAVVSAILEVNRYEEIVGFLKKIAARSQAAGRVPTQNAKA